ncbi:ATP-dependent Clp protease proteolytic subunit [Alistipes sp. OttesenSCG-928-L06]|nr:ATP-dependent Clp protease proteolytic subunit [Alistipes sp. OttesenSCG-928-L06]
MSGQISIRNQSKKITEIHIEGMIGVPEKMQFDDPKERIATYDAFQNAIRNISEIRTKTIIVNIRSTGGNVNDALLIYDALIGLESEIVTRCYGYVASAATIIAQAAAKGRREISKNALYLIHQASSSAEGNSGELAQTIDLLGKTDRRIAGVYADASGRDPEKFIALMQENNGNGRWLSPEEALKEGLADKIIAPGEISNDAQETLRKMNLPEIPQNLLKPVTPKKGMKIRKHWNAILDFLKVNTDENPVLNENQVESINQELGKRADAIAVLEAQIAQYENPKPHEDGQEIADLQNRIVELEALNAKLRAKATQTLPKEDPSNREIKRAGNAAAYENDMKNLLQV